MTNPRTIAALAVALLLLVTQIPARAQTPATGSISGQVVDADTKIPLPTAAVRVLETQAHETSHTDGRFAFARVQPGTYTLTAERIGFHTERVRVVVRAGATATVVIELHAAPVELARIVVTGALSARTGHDLLSPASVVAGKELDRRLDATVAASVAREPGVSTVSMGTATARPVIRGLGGDRILVLEDGQRPGDLSSTSGDHAVAVEPLTAQQLEVVRGPMSLLYGSSALGGVVNVVREEIPQSVPEHAHGVFTAQAATVSRGGGAGASSTFGLGEVALRFEGSARASGDVRTPDGPLANTDAKTFNAAAGAALVKDWGMVGASYRHYRNDYGIPGGFVGGHAAGVDIEMRRHTGRAQLEWRPRGAAISTLNADATLSIYRHGEFGASGLLGTLFEQAQLSGEVRARHDARGPWQEGALGVRAQYRDVHTSGSLRTPSTEDYSIAGYAVEELGTGALRMQLGARYDYSHYRPRELTTITVGGRDVTVRARSFGAVSGALGVLWSPTEATRVGASLSRAYRTPDFNELYSDGPHLAANSYDVGNPELEAETGIGADVFVRVQHEQLRAEVAVFRNYLNEFIFPSSQGRVERGPQEGRPRLQYANEDARFTGAEGDLDWNVAQHWVVHSTVSYVRAVFTSARDSIPLFENQDTILIPASADVPLIPPLNGVIGVRYDTPGVFAGAAMRWAAEQDRLGDFEQITDGYGVFDLDAGIRFIRAARSHTITLRLDNVLDTEYRQHLSRIKDIMPEPGRGLSMMYRLTF